MHTLRPPNPYTKSMENRRPKNHHQVGRSTADVARCKKHPKHQQPPGVCSVCLRERLSKLSTGSRSTTITSIASFSSSSLSSLSSHYSSSESSPVHHRYADLGAKGSLSFSRSGDNNNVFMTKSRSMAFVPRRREGEGKKKEGFWSKLLRPRSKKMDGGLMHSWTMRERVSTTTRVH